MPTFIDKVRTFFGVRQEPPKNDFRNPIWGSDDDDDGDELYTRDQQMTIFNESSNVEDRVHAHILEALEIFKTFGNMFSDMRDMFDDTAKIDSFTSSAEIPQDSDPASTDNLRDYYLKPGYQKQKLQQPKQDIDLDGKISSHDLSGLLNSNDNNTHSDSIMPYIKNLKPGSSFYKTVITTSIKKPDGTIETHKIIRDGNNVIEEMTTTNGPSPAGPFSGGYNSSSSEYYDAMLRTTSLLSSLFTKFY